MLDRGRRLWTAIAWLGAAAIALALALPAVWWEPLHADEVVTLGFARGSPAEIVQNVFVDRGGAPLHFLVERATLAWPDGLVGLRVPSIVFFVLALPAAGLVARLLVDGARGRAAAARAGVRPARRRARHVRAHVLAPARGDALGDGASRSGPRGADGLLAWTLCGVGAGLLVYVHPVAPLYSALVVLTGLLCAAAAAPAAPADGLGRAGRARRRAGALLRDRARPLSDRYGLELGGAAGAGNRRGGALRGRAGADRARPRRAGRLVLRSRARPRRARLARRRAAPRRPRAGALARRPGGVLHLRPDRDELVPPAPPPPRAAVLPAPRRRRLPRARVVRPGRGRRGGAPLRGPARLAARRRREEARRAGGPAAADARRRGRAARAGARLRERRAGRGRRPAAASSSTSTSSSSAADAVAGARGRPGGAGRVRRRAARSRRPASGSSAARRRYRSTARGRLEDVAGVEVVAVSPSVLLVRSAEPLAPRPLVELSAALREAWLEEVPDDREAERLLRQTATRSAPRSR